MRNNDAAHRVVRHTGGRAEVRHGTQIFSRRIEGRRKRNAPTQKRTLKSGKGGRGGKVKSRKQAIAIGLSEARKKGKKVPKKRASK